jgi:hypothetical protein
VNEPKQGLEKIRPGRADWSLYQETVRDILAEMFCPPLEQPLTEHSNQGGVSRRDIIFPNYMEQGFWKFLRDHYEAHYIVFDTKNYTGNVKKNDVLQLANYLNTHGAGLLGVLVCRNAADRSAEVTRREQWILHRKMIIVLNDHDLEQMQALFFEDDDPVKVIKQKIEDFRLSF